MTLPTNDCNFDVSSDDAAVGLHPFADGFPPALNDTALTAALEEGADFALRPLPPENDEPLANGLLTFRMDSKALPGGQGQVFRVTSLRTGNEYALKLFRSRTAAQQEWRILLNHKNDETVPLAYAFGELAAGLGEIARETGAHRGKWAIVMEYVRGKTLHELLLDRQWHAHLTVEKALRIAAPIVRFCANSCRSRTHDVHRDIKPSNIIVSNPETGDGARLIDFGIAANPDNPLSSRGTLGYSAPELDAAANTPDKPDDCRVDTYSIAATLFALLQNGHPPRMRPTAQPDACDETRTSAQVHAADAQTSTQVHTQARETPSSSERAQGIELSTELLRHDPTLTRKLEEHVRHYLSTTYGESFNEETARNACSFAFSVMDAKLADRLTACLSPEQSKRPTPEELEILLPLNPENYEQELFNTAVIDCLKKASGQRNDAAFAPLSQAIAADKTFQEALSAFNRGYYDEALPVLEALANQRDASAMYYLAICLRDSLGCEHDPERMAFYFSEAANQGNIVAQNAFGHMLLEGLGVPANPEKGIEWIRASAADAPGKTGFPLAKKWLEEHGY